MKKRLKVNGVLIFLGVLSVAVFPGFFFRASRGAGRDIFITACGTSLILLGQFFRASGRGYKSEHSQNGSALAGGGPYALVRNPMYLGILLIGLGIVAVLFSWWVAGVFLAIFLLRYILLIFSEEKKLSEMFPREFLEYKARVPRLMPSMRQLLRDNITAYLPLKREWLRNESGSMLAALCATFLLKAWADIRAGGLGIYLGELATALTAVLLFAALAVYLIRHTERNR